MLFNGSMDMHLMVCMHVIVDCEACAPWKLKRTVMLEERTKILKKDMRNLYLQFTAPSACLIPFFLNNLSKIPQILTLKVSLITSILLFFLVSFDGNTS